MLYFEHIKFYIDTWDHDIQTIYKCYKPVSISQNQGRQAKSDIYSAYYLLVLGLSQVCLKIAIYAFEHYSKTQSTILNIILSKSTLYSRVGCFIMHRIISAYPDCCIRVSDCSIRVS